MSRFASQYTFCSPDLILKKMIVEQNSQQEIIDIFSMNNGRVEAANTVFYNGIFSTDIISLKQNLTHEEILEISKDYLYIDLSEHDAFITIQDDKPLLVDFGTNKQEVINLQFEKLLCIVGNVSIFEIIAACTYNPSKILKRQSVFEVGIKTNIILWEGADLVNKTLTNKTRIRNLNQ